MNKQKSTEQILAELSAPFTTIGLDGKIYPAHKWFQKTKQGGCVPYIDARQVMQRLNDVLGIEGWSNQLIETTSAGLICELSIIVNGQQITKSNVGTKSAFEAEKGQASDAIKRAAVAFGIGAYIYEISPVTIKMAGGKLVTEKNEPLDSPDKLTSYINMKNPYKAKISEVFFSFSKEKQAELNDSFKLIWNNLT
jgi:hypothetical protein